CYGKGLDREFTKDSLSAFQDGYDPTQLPPLDSLGLGILLTSDVKSQTSQFSSEHIASLTSIPNPFTKETTLGFTLNRTTYTTIEIYDELGRLIWGDGIGLSLEAGTHSITVDGKSLPHGTLYARISTGFGEVKTVKLVHD
ncbi:MAG: T9SS type A sorting domain-containing protein, partial [Bacteroidota bacterium]|nr:T9SS type A sorting domain-containing protein [Bacteroidota bacterium]